MSNIARGIRNNNPLNIRRGAKWQGLADQQTDKEFCQFKSISWGLRAAFLLIKNYIQGRTSDHVKRRSIFAIIHRWAPGSENNTDAYIQIVCKRTGIGQFDTILWEDRQKVVSIVMAMAYVECGIQLDKELCYSAYDMVR